MIYSRKHKITKYSYLLCLDPLMLKLRCNQIRLKNKGMSNFLLLSYNLVKRFYESALLNILNNMF